MEVRINFQWIIFWHEPFLYNYNREKKIIILQTINYLNKSKQRNKIIKYQELRRFKKLEKSSLLYRIWVEAQKLFTSIFFTEPRYTGLKNDRFYKIL